jgi:hypothetical protein
VNAQVPPRAGKIVKVEWDFEGTGKFTVDSQLARPGPVTDLHVTYTFTRREAYLPVVRVTSQRTGIPRSPYGLAQNLASV